MWPWRPSSRAKKSCCSVSMSSGSQQPHDHSRVDTSETLEDSPGLSRTLLPFIHEEHLSKAGHLTKVMSDYSRLSSRHTPSQHVYFRKYAYLHTFFIQYLFDIYRTLVCPGLWASGDNMGTAICAFICLRCLRLCLYLPVGPFLPWPRDIGREGTWVLAHLELDSASAC